MSRLALFQKPHWQHFLGIPSLGDLPTSALLAADSFFEHVAETGLAAPGAGDFAQWALGAGAADAGQRLKDLRCAFAICLPGVFEAPLVEAGAFVERQLRLERPRPTARRAGEAPEARPTGRMTAAWDPIAPPRRPPPKARSVSVEPWHLPDAWQSALRRAAAGLPLNGVCVAPPIVKRMREKLCQLAWCAKNATLAPSLEPAVTEHFLGELKTRLEQRETGLRWATVRATLEELHRFARMTGAPQDIVHHLAALYWEAHSRERLQLALKHFRIFKTGHTTDSLLDLGESFLATSGTLACADKRHRMRNAACILGLYPIAPLRNASAYLVFGETLHWSKDHWVLDLRIQKTARHRPERFVMPLEPETGRFIDAVVLGDLSVLLLPDLRRRLQDQRRPLFVLPDGRPAAASYAPRIFKALTGNSFTDTRTMLHTDEAIRNGEAGVEAARVACHQKPGSPIHERYQLQLVAQHGIDHLRTAKRRRRLEMLAGTS